jgi:transcriptional regulator with XRE-family HTH domain
VLRLMLGLELRRLREARNVSAADAAKAIRATPSKISRMELGRSAIKEIDVADLLTLYGVGPEERLSILGLAEQASQPGFWQRYSDILPDWFKMYIGLEESAKSIRTYEPLFVPGLLQTPQYAAAVLALDYLPPTEVERLVLLRKERQRRFNEGQLRLWAIVDESALRQTIGGADIMRDQLEHLISLSTNQNLTLQVTPLAAGSHAAPSAFSILRFSEPEIGDVVYVEQLTGALYIDKKDDVDRYLLAMERLSTISAKPPRTREILRALIDRLG